MRLRRESGGLDRRKEGGFIANQNELRNKFELNWTLSITRPLLFHLVNPPLTHSGRLGQRERERETSPWTLARSSRLTRAVATVSPLRNSLKNDLPKPPSDNPVCTVGRPEHPPPALPARIFESESATRETNRGLSRLWVKVPTLDRTGKSIERKSSS